MDQESNTKKNIHQSFEPTPTPAWRTFLSIGLAILAVGRLAYTCSGAKTANASQQDNELQSIINENQTRYEENRRERATENQRVSNEIMYTDYQNLDKVAQEQGGVFKMSKIKNDTVVLIDLSTKLKVQKNSFYQKNYDSSLAMAVKTPQELTVFIHSFPGEGDLKYNFLEMKRKQQLSDFQLVKKAGSANIYSYSILQNNKVFHGCALAVKSEGYFFFMEIESDKIKKKILKQKALEYLAANFQKV